MLQFTRLGPLTIVCTALLALLPRTTAAATLTDLTVFSANSDGHAYYSLFWNTQGAPDNRFNLYVSTSPVADPPTFINGYDDARTEIAIDLQPGTYYFTLFGESAFTPVPADVHFVTNLYFNNDQSGAGISGLFGPACLPVCAAGSLNGLDIAGNAFQPEAGTLNWTDGPLLISLTEFTWITDSDAIDTVWPYWANHLDYSSGSGTPDFFGTLRLDVRSAPEPGAALLLVAGIGAAIRSRRRAQR